MPGEESKPFSKTMPDHVTIMWRHLSFHLIHLWFILEKSLYWCLTSSFKCLFIWCRQNWNVLLSEDSSLQQSVLFYFIIIIIIIIIYFFRTMFTSIYIYVYIQFYFYMDLSSSVSIHARQSDKEMWRKLFKGFFALRIDLCSFFLTLSFFFLLVFFSICDMA